MSDTGPLRREVRAVLSTPAARRAWRALAEPGPWGEPDPRPLYRLLGSHRLLAPGWPGAFGGRDLPLADAAAVAEEMIFAGIPDTLHTLSVQICGTFLLGAGTPAQRATLLPGLAAGRRFCTVLYTEPEAGSDLAALETQARPAPGGWQISGHKLYSVRTALADIGLVAARTSQEVTKYGGLTLFLVPLTAAGVTVSRLPALADEAFADVRLDQVLAGADAVIGEVGEAWPLITEALALERTGVDHAAKAAAWLALATASATGDGWRERAGQLRTRTAAARAMSRRCVSELDRGGLAPEFAAATKLWCSETAREVAEWAAGVLGDSALWPAGEPDAVAGGRLEAAYREAPGLVISAGTSEMMREIVAGAGLTGALGGGGTDRADRSARADLGSSTGSLTAASGDPVAPAGGHGLANGTGSSLADRTGDLPGGAGGVLAELRAAVRSAARSGENDPACRDDLAGLGLLRLGVDPAAGGLGLGPLALVAACEELGARGYDGGVLDTLTVVAAVAGLTPEHPRRAALPALLDGSARGGLVLAGRPSRPLADPGPAGLLLVLHGWQQLAGTGSVAGQQVGGTGSVAGQQPSGTGSVAGQQVGGTGSMAGEPLASPGRAPASVPATPEAGLALSVLGAGDPGVVRRARRTMARDVVTVELAPGLAGCGLEHPDTACRALLAADLLRRAAWLIGAGTSCLTAAGQRVRTRRQFGRALLDNQAIAHRLAGLAVHAEALRALLHSEAARADAAERDAPGSDPEVPGGLVTCAGLLAEAGRFARHAAAAGIHLHGASGMVAGSPAGRAFRVIPLAIAGGFPPPLLDRIAGSPAGQGADDPSGQVTGGQVPGGQPAAMAGHLAAAQEAGG